MNSIEWIGELFGFRQTREKLERELEEDEEETDEEEEEEE